MRNRIGIVLALALVSGAVAAYLAFSYLRSPTDGGQGDAAAGGVAEVAVATRDMAVGTILRPEDVKLVKWPAAAVPQGYATSTEEVLGRGLISPVSTNEPLLAAKLARKEAGGGLPIAIPEGMRAMSVKVNEVIGVAGYVLPGTHVDVLVTLKKQDAGGDARTEILLQNLTVVTAGQERQQDREGKPKTVPVVTLLVTPEQAEKLTLAASQGELQLALRNTLDEDSVQTDGARLTRLLPSSERVVRRPVGRRAPSGPPSRVNVEVYRGPERSTSTVDTAVTGGER